MSSSSPRRSHEAGRWPAMAKRGDEPRALPWAGMNDAVGVALPEPVPRSGIRWAQRGLEEMWVMTSAEALGTGTEDE